MIVTIYKRDFLRLMSENRLLDHDFSISGAHQLYDLITEHEQKMIGFHYHVVPDQLNRKFKQMRGKHIVNLYDLTVDQLILDGCETDEEVCRYLADVAENWLKERTPYKRFNGDSFVYMRGDFE